MSLAALYNVPKDARGLAQFAFENQMSHIVIARAISRAGGPTIAVPILDPMPPFDIQTWAGTHQIVHNAMNSALGLEGNDLTDVDWTKPEQVASWIELHAAEHYRASQKLGVA